MNEQPFTESVLQELNNYLFKVFLEIAVIYGNNKKSLKKMLISLLLVEDINKIFNEISPIKDNSSYNYSDDDIHQIKNLQKTFIAISSLIHGKIDEIKQLDIFNSHVLTPKFLKIISSHTKIGLETMIYEIK